MLGPAEYGLLYGTLSAVLGKLFHILKHVALIFNIAQTK